MTSDLLRPAEAAGMLLISIDTLRGHIRDGSLTCTIIGRGKIKKRYAIDIADLEDFKRRQKETGGRVECPSTSRKGKPRTINMTSSSEVIDFKALRAQLREQKQKK